MRVQVQAAFHSNAMHITGKRYRLRRHLALGVSNGQHIKTKHVYWAFTEVPLKLESGA